MSNTNEKLRIAYLNNPDPVFFNELDKKLQDLFTGLGAIVTPFELDDINFKIQTNKISFFLGDSKDEFEFDAFMFYGYMSKFKEIAFSFLLTAMEKSGKFVLHEVNNLKIMGDKLLQSFYYSGHNIGIPETYSAFSINGIKNITSIKLDSNEACVSKNLNDYAGDGVKLCGHKDVAINTYAKYFWNKEYSLIQKFIPDSHGKSIRVLLIGGKPAGICEYQDQTGDFRSNISFNREFILVDQKDNPKKDEYIKLAVDSLKSIGNGNILIAGVDIIDSKKLGLNVLEVNCFPDLYDISKSTQNNYFENFTQYFYRKALENKLKKK